MTGGLLSHICKQICRYIKAVVFPLVSLLPARRRNDFRPPPKRKTEEKIVYPLELYAQHAEYQAEIFKKINELEERRRQLWMVLKWLEVPEEYLTEGKVTEIQSSLPNSEKRRMIYLEELKLISKQADLITESIKNFEQYVKNKKKLQERDMEYEEMAEDSKEDEIVSQRLRALSRKFRTERKKNIEVLGEIYDQELQEEALKCQEKPQEGSEPNAMMYKFLEIRESLQSRHIEFMKEISQFIPREEFEAMTDH